MAKAKCTVRFERSRAAGGTKVDAVLYARDGRSLNYLAMPTPVRAAAARQAKALLMRGCSELSRKKRGAQLGFIWPFKKKRKLRVGEKRIMWIPGKGGGSAGRNVLAGARRRRKRR